MFHLFSSSDRLHDGSAWRNCAASHRQSQAVTVASIAQRGFVANTDWDWYRYLLTRAQRPDEVNFWRPSGTTAFHAVEAGSPFFFRLKRPHDAIGGFGIFKSFVRLPVWLAWQSFGDLNGAPNFETMAARLEHYRRRFSDHPEPHSGDFEIGCIIISQPTFFSEDEWVNEPAGWQPNIVSGKGLGVLDGEGQRLLAECLERAQLHSHSDELLVAVEAARRGKPVHVEPRLGQGTFRLAVISAYDRACAVTHEHSLPVLEAAPIRPFGQGGAHDARNGILLRSDVHRLFDLGYVTVTPDFMFKVSSSLMDDYHNGREYDRYHGATVSVPTALALQPSRELLDWHGQSVYRG